MIELHEDHSIALPYGGLITKILHPTLPKIAANEHMEASEDCVLKLRSGDDQITGALKSFQNARYAVASNQILVALNSARHFGSVYKRVLSSNGAIIAVKVLNLQQRGGSKSFINECNVLRSLRHRNLLKVITACSSIDHQGNDFKSLVFEFMSNGSLDEWLHAIEDEQHQCKRLSFIQRLDIAMDVAYALQYLHLHCQTPIIHCDLKPSNVLLNEDMVAHVADFGLAKFIIEASHNPSKTQSMSDFSVALRGSIGYIPLGLFSTNNSIQAKV
ncbi:probable LRR receptor-like serine/threonine-protein kinase At3g47570 [Corylus avellana]|uniref:probable LRR receptor-like serine/threonine-protein kinase At3g47570 n=1 Tax=Corylus avellana TaxID=13451 RepID=UPI00286D0C4A|nr:probable LRR receptor-like serine/threonine-protein kinase At3g47570 [Corylus avellana]